MPIRRTDVSQSTRPPVDAEAEREREAMNATFSVLQDVVNARAVQLGFARVEFRSHPDRPAAPVNADFDGRWPKTVVAVNADNSGIVAGMVIPLKAPTASLSGRSKFKNGQELFDEISRLLDSARAMAPYDGLHHVRDVNFDPDA